MKKFVFLILCFILFPCSVFADNLPYDTPSYNNPFYDNPLYIYGETLSENLDDLSILPEKKEYSKHQYTSSEEVQNIENAERIFEYYGFYPGPQIFSIENITPFDWEY